MSVFGDIVKESRCIDDKVCVIFDEENYRRLELKLKIQEEENKRLNAELELYKDNDEHLNNLLRQKDNIIKEIREYIYELKTNSDERALDKMIEILDKDNSNE